MPQSAALLRMPFVGAPAHVPAWALPLPVPSGTPRNHPGPLLAPFSCPHSRVPSQPGSAHSQANDSGLKTVTWPRGPGWGSNSQPPHSRIARPRGAAGSTFPGTGGLRVLSRVWGGDGRGLVQEPQDLPAQPRGSDRRLEPGCSGFCCQGGPCRLRGPWASVFPSLGLHPRRLKRGESRER